jgi:hypothetical protein
VLSHVWIANACPPEQASEKVWFANGGVIHLAYWDEFIIAPGCHGHFFSLSLWAFKKSDCRAVLRVDVSL